MKAMLKSLAPFFSVALVVLFLASCSHPIVIVGNGDVRSESGERDCLLEDFLAGQDNCTKNYVVHDYEETYNADPRPGWQFERWVNYCGNATDNTCSFDISAGTVHQFWGETALPLLAVFTKIDDPDTVVVDGKAWPAS